MGLQPSCPSGLQFHLKAPPAEGLVVRLCHVGLFTVLSQYLQLASPRANNLERVRKQVPEMKGMVFSYPHLRSGISSLLQGSAH